MWISFLYRKRKALSTWSAEAFHIVHTNVSFLYRLIYWKKGKNIQRLNDFEHCCICLNIMKKMICWNQKRGWWRFSYPKGSRWASTRKYRRMTALVNRNGDAIGRGTLPLWLGGLLWIENSSGKDGREEVILTQTHRNQVSWGSYDMALYFDSRANREHLQSHFNLWYFSGTKVSSGE